MATTRNQDAYNFSKLFFRPFQMVPYHTTHVTSQLSNQRYSLYSVYYFSPPGQQVKGKFLDQYSETDIQADIMQFVSCIISSGLKTVTPAATAGYRYVLGTCEPTNSVYHSFLGPVTHGVILCR